jgi:hypothetical protein
MKTNIIMVNTVSSDPIKLEGDALQDVDSFIYTEQELSVDNIARREV